MPLKRIYFDVYLDNPEDPDQPTYHRVEVRGADQLRAELEGKRHMVSLKESMHQTYLWAWASLVRQGLYSDTFAAFRDAVIQVQGEDDDDPGEDVDPTQPGATDG